MIPAKSPFIPNLMKQFHNSSVGGHEWVLKTFKRMARKVLWKGMRSDITEFIKGSEVCQKIKVLHPLPCRLAVSIAYTSTGLDRYQLGFSRRVAIFEGV